LLDVLGLCTSRLKLFWLKTGMRFIQLRTAIFRLLIWQRNCKIIYRVQNKRFVNRNLVNVAWLTNLCFYWMYKRFIVWIYFCLKCLLTWLSNLRLSHKSFVRCLETARIFFQNLVNTHHRKRACHHCN